MKKFKLTLLLSFPFLLLGQAQLLPLNHEISGRYEKTLNQKGQNFHTGSKPYILSLSRQTQGFDSLNNALAGTRTGYLTNQHLLSKQTGGVLLSADPYLDALPAFELGQGAKYELSIGANLNLSLSNKLHVNTILSKGYAQFPSFIDSISRRTETVPGRAYAFPRGNTLGFLNNSAYASYSPSGYFNFQLGFSRNFFGDGYRSLLLSDNAYSYPFAKITTTIWKLQYVNLFANFRDIRFSGGDPSEFYNKFGSFHFLSWNITKRLNFGLFEAIVFENRDTTGKKLGFDVNYLNPVVFYRPVEYAIGSADNALMGLNMKYALFNKQVLYGQVMLDEFLMKEVRADLVQLVSPSPERTHGWWANKYGFQLGLKWFDFLKIENLQFQAEHNLVRPYSYTHSSVPQNYGHYNQALAHPTGANFREYLAIFRYYHKRFSADAKINYIVYGDDTEGVYYGRDIFRSYQERSYEHGHVTGQGVSTTLLHSELRLSYLINPKNNLLFQVGLTSRQLSRQSGPGQDSAFLFAGIRTGVLNWYYDR